VFKMIREIPRRMGSNPPGLKKNQVQCARINIINSSMT
jgi:hypothetical protein